MKKIAIIGAGNMGGAIARGILGSNLADSYSVAVADLDAAKLQQLSSEFPAVVTSTDASAIVGGARFVVLAVKPWLVETVLAPLASKLNLNQGALVSLAPGFTVERLCEIINNPQAQDSVFRIMPNTAIAYGESMTLVAGIDAPDRAKADELLTIMGAMGKADLIPERLMNAGMALCSCGIAYVMRYVRAATEGAVQLGLYPDQAKEYMLQTLQGAIAVLRATGANPEAQIDKVTTPGGTTIRGLNAMEANGFTNAVIAGLIESAR